ncbi:MAG: hypothetical protein OXR66_03515 [Candidatus Woesearchaeota archaeon]|nr:hypothetical protein [Candidatus Woesearchaeota archaeon]
MKVTIDNLEKTHAFCLSTGKIKEKTADRELIKSLKFVAEKGIDFIDRRSEDISEESDEWTFVFREYYESLRGLIEAYILFEGIEADNHQCKNAYLCYKHPELELDWNFLETIRLKRNAINYRGQLLTFTDWNAFQLQLTLHINALKKEIEQKLG